MDSREWKDQLQSDQHQPSAKIPKIQLEDHQQWQQHMFHSPSSTLTLFTPEPGSSNENTTITTAPHLSAFPRMRLAQWQELQLQALIYRYMISGIAVPLELILHIKRCLFNQDSSYHDSQLYQHFSSSVARCVVDPEPGRCRRTDGKKWRCSREVMKGQKYCERHVHRGRNRSRKHVETPLPAYISCLKTAIPFPGSAKESQFNLSGSLKTLDILPLNQRTSENQEVEGGLQINRSDFSSHQFQASKGNNHVLQCLFNEWPRSQGKLNTTSKASHSASTTQPLASISGNSSSGISLKLSTADDPKPMPESKDGEAGLVLQPSANWLGWGNGGEASMDGPLAEALHPPNSSNIRV